MYADKYNFTHTRVLYRYKLVRSPELTLGLVS